MKHQEGVFMGVRNTALYYQGWLPEGEIRAVLLVVHGLAEHSGRYMNLVNRFVPLGYAVYGSITSGTAGPKAGGSMWSALSIIPNRSRLMQTWFDVGSRTSPYSWSGTAWEG